MKPLDFIKTKKGAIGMINEVSTTQNIYTACITFIDAKGETKSAWWSADEFEIIGSLPDLLSKNLCHSFSNSSLQPFKLNKI